MRRKWHELFSEEELERDEIDRLMVDMPGKSSSDPTPPVSKLNVPLQAACQVIRKLLEKEIWMPQYAVEACLVEFEELMILDSNVELGEAKLRNLGKTKGKHVNKSKTRRVQSRNT